MNMFYYYVTSLFYEYLHTFQMKILPNLNDIIMNPIVSFGYDLLFLLLQFQHNLKDEMIMNKIMEIVYSVSTSCLKIISLQEETEVIIDVKDNNCYCNYCNGACNSVKKSFGLLDDKAGM